MKVSGKTNSWTTYLEPLNIFTWLAIPTTILLCTIAFGFASKYGPGNHQDREFARNNFSCGLLLSVHALLCQGFPYSPNDLSKRIIFLFLFFTGYVTFAAYSACLTSFLAVKVAKLPFHDRLSLLYKSDYKVITLESSFFEDLFKVSSVFLFVNQIIGISD